MHREEHSVMNTRCSRLWGLLVCGLLAAQDVPRSAARSSAQQNQPGAAAAFSNQEKPGSITGVVLSVTGEPLRKVALQLMPADGGRSQMLAAETTEDGRFNFTNVPPGRYFLSAEKAGYVRQPYGAAPGLRRGSPLSVNPGQELTGVTLKMIPHAVISGKVTDEDGEPMYRGFVQALERRSFRGQRQLVPVAGSQINDLGEYRIAGLAPGRYYIAVNPTPGGVFSGAPGRGRGRPSVSGGEMSYVTTYYPGVTDLSQATALELTQGVQLNGIDLRLRKTKTFSISGRVLDENGAPASEVGVMLLPAGEQPSLISRNFAPVREGVFRMANVLPGSYILLAFRMRSSVRAAARQQVQVSDRDLEDVALSLEPGLTIAGRVRSEENAPLPVSLRVSLTPTRALMVGGVPPAEVKDNGTFELQGVLPEKYTISISSLPDGMYVKEIRFGGQPVPNSQVDISTSAQLELLLSPTAGQVSGSVTDSEQKPVAGARVVLIPPAEQRSSPENFRATEADQNGAFAFRNLPPGDYKLLALLDVDDGEWLEPGFIERYESRAVSVTVAARSSQNFQLKPVEVR
jgi:protocatechuate 3,4-dioxygenase beta subunit